MDLESPYPQLIIKPNHSNPIHISELPTAPRIHIVPATAKQNAYKADVSNYFASTIKPHQTHEKCLQATLLGHQLIGKLHKIPQTCDAYLMKDKNQLTMTLLRKCEDAVDWRKDRPWADNEGVIVNIRKCMQLQNALHGFES